MQWLLADAEMILFIRMMATIFYLMMYFLWLTNQLIRVGVIIHVLLLIMKIPFDV